MNIWVKEHADALIIIAVILGSFSSMHSKMCEIDEKVASVMHDLDKRLTAIETIMLMQGAPIRAFVAEEKK